jgi:hypothetical protein
LAGLFAKSYFSPEKAKFHKHLQVTLHQCLTHPLLLPKNVLTAKTALFLGVLAGKQGFGVEKKHYFLHFFTF